MSRKVYFNINRSSNGSFILFTSDVNEVFPLFQAINRTIGFHKGIEYSGAMVECLKISREGAAFWKVMAPPYIFIDSKNNDPFFLINKTGELILNFDKNISSLKNKVCLENNPWEKLRRKGEKQYRISMSSLS